MYDEQRIRDSEQNQPRESRIKPSENKTFAETALVGAGVAALGAAIMASRDKGKGKGKGKDPEPRQSRHERYGHDDHREEDTIVQDSRRAKELALEKEIERLERALAERNKARERRKRDSKRDGGMEPSGNRTADVDLERDYEKRHRNRDSRYSEPDYIYERPETSRRVSEPGERPAAAYPGQTRRAELPAVPSSSGVDVFQFQVPDDAFRTRDSPLRAASPVIIDVTPAPSPPLEEVDRKSRRESFEDEMRDAKHIYDESMHSTAPILAVDMAAAIAATERARRQDEPERGRTLAKTQDLVQEEANAYYHARRMAEREVSSRSRSKSAERSVVEKYEKDQDHESQGAEIVRIVTPPEMMQKPQKHKYSEPNADFRFDNLMSPKDLDYFRPQEYQVRDPSAERPRPLLNLVIPTPVPTPTPDSQKKKAVSSISPEPVVEEPERGVPDVVISPREEIVEAPQTPTSKRVSWGPSETQQYEVESPDRSSERNSRSYDKPRSPGKSSGWGATAATVAGIAAAAALSKDDGPERSSRDDSSRESTGAKSSEGSRSPPSRKVLPKGTASSRVMDDEPEDVPPAPGPKPASPRSSQMPGAFADDLDFAATLAAGLQDTGFDPNIVIEDAAYRRRDSPPGSNEHTGVYMQPFSETVTDLGVVDIDNEPRPARESGYVIGELTDTPASERGSTFDWAEGPSRRQSKSEKRRSAGSDNFEAAQEPEKDYSRLSKEEQQRKIEKAARAAKLVEEDDRASQPAEAGDDDWEKASTSRKSKSTSKSKRTSLGWDDADTPVNDRRVSVPVDAFDDLEDTKPVDTAWNEPQRTSKSKRDSKSYDVTEDPSDRRERRREERRRSDYYEPLERDITSVVSDSRHDDRSNGRGRHQHDDERSVVSAPDGKRDRKQDKRSSREEKRSSGGFWGLLKGSNGVDGENQSKKDNAGTLGAGAGLAGAVAVASLASGSLASRSDPAEAPSEQEETQDVIVDVDHPSGRRTSSPSRGTDVFDFQDPEITPRVIKPAIDPHTREIKPLYLIERSAHAGAEGGDQEHDDQAENMPLPPSRESPAPESENGGDVEKEARVLEVSGIYA
ncbi:putative involucrin repeat protein [Diaporthe ampelina]|uniref:Putative involucrin repeat protein n=1 Tax=Diaporthe ampelina TaxID=1214573 RepID=A0A0G2FKE1_9PEZI|nr:putative involucrin repeat protein [Diaporthe ampelina]